MSGRQAGLTLFSRICYTSPGTAASIDARLATIQWQTRWNRLRYVTPLGGPPGSIPAS